MTETAREWRGRTMDERRAERRAALIDAALDLIAERGTASITTREVCRRAGLIERYLYESFASRDELVVAAFDSAVDGAMTATIDAFRGAWNVEPSERFRIVLSTALDYADQREGLAHLLLDAASDPLLREHGMAALSSLNSVATGFIATMVDGRRSAADIAFAGAAVTGAALSVFVNWLGGGVDMSRDELLDRAVAVIRAIIAA